METGIVRLENSDIFPFNNSAQTVALQRERFDADYAVLTEVRAAGGPVGEVRVTARAVNGFLLEYTGSAPWAELRWTLVGGDA